MTPTHCILILMMTTTISNSKSSSSSTTSGGSSSGANPPSLYSAETDFTNLLNKLAMYFQIRDDFLNVSSVEYMQAKVGQQKGTTHAFSMPSQY